jgi:hypothetical protein
VESILSLITGQDRDRRHAPVPNVRRNGKKPPRMPGFRKTRDILQAGTFCYILFIDIMCDHFTSPYVEDVY